MWRRDRAPGRRLRLCVGIAAMAALALLAAACSGSAHSTTHVRPRPTLRPRPRRPPCPGEDNARERRRRCRPVRGHYRHGGARHAEERHGAHRRRRGDRPPQPGRQGLAQPVGAGRLADLQGDGHSVRKRHRQRHRHEHVPHADAGPDVHHRDSRGLQPDLRGGDAGHLVLQPAHHRQGRGRAGVADHDVEAGSRRVVWDVPCNMAVTCAYFRPRDDWPAG